MLEVCMVPLPSYMFPICFLPQSAGSKQAAAMSQWLFKRHGITILLCCYWGLRGLQMKIGCIGWAAESFYNEVDSHAAVG